MLQLGSISGVLNTSGTQGMFLKTSYIDNGQRYYVKTGEYNEYTGFGGFEPYYEVIVSRLARKLGIPCVMQHLDKATFEYKGKRYCTDVCVSKSYRKDYESRLTFEKYYEQANKGEDVVSFAQRTMGSLFSQMLILDFVITNRDRHGANIEFYNHKGKITPAPLFDNGLSFFCFCLDDNAICKSDVMSNMAVNNYIGSRSLFYNLRFVDKSVKLNYFDEHFKSYLFRGLITALTKEHRDMIWLQITRRLSYVTGLLNT